MHLYHMHSTARSIDGREIPLMLVIKETLKCIGHKAIEKLKEQVIYFIYLNIYIYDVRLEK